MIKTQNFTQRNLHPSVPKRFESLKYVQFVYFQNGRRKKIEIMFFLTRPTSYCLITLLIKCLNFEIFCVFINNILPSLYRLLFYQYLNLIRG